MNDDDDYDNDIVALGNAAGHGCNCRPSYYITVLIIELFDFATVLIFYVLQTGSTDESHIH